MGQIKVGTASWTDKTLLASGWYPGRRRHARSGGWPTTPRSSRWSRSTRPTTRRRPSRPRTLWAAADPGRLHLQHQGVQPADRPSDQGLARSTRTCGRRPSKTNVYPKDLDADVIDQVWERFLSALEPLADGGQARRAAVPVPAVVHHPPRPTSSTSLEVRSAVQAAAGCASSSATRRGSTATTGPRRWTSCATYELPYVGGGHAAGPHARRSAGARGDRDLAVVRFHGHSDKWTSKDIYEKFGYLYSEDELQEWAPKLEQLARDGERDARAHEQLLSRLRAEERAPAGGPARPPRRGVTRASSRTCSTCPMRVARAGWRTCSTCPAPDVGRRAPPPRSGPPVRPVRCRRGEVGVGVVQGVEVDVAVGVQAVVVAAVGELRQTFTS